MIKVKMVTHGLTHSFCVMNFLRLLYSRKPNNGINIKTEVKATSTILPISSAIQLAVS